MNGLTKAASDVLAERARQINAEGWTPEHDDEHDDGSLALAAACYAAPMATKGKTDDVDVSNGRGETPVWRGKRFVVPFLWPASWHGSWWKPKDRRQDLVRATALLLAEIERLDRAAGNAGVLASDGWLPIATVPKDGREVILREGRRVGAACWVEWPDTYDNDGAPNREGGEGWTIGYDGDEWRSPDAWQPLPAAHGVAIPEGGQG